MGHSLLAERDNHGLITANKRARHNKRLDALLTEAKQKAPTSRDIALDVTPAWAMARDPVGANAFGAVLVATAANATRRRAGAVNAAFHAARIFRASAGHGDSCLSSVTPSVWSTTSALSSSHRP
jgi:hypothetical protein